MRLVSASRRTTAAKPDRKAPSSAAADAANLPSPSVAVIVDGT